MSVDGLPVKGYQPQSEDNVAAVNKNKEIEERCIRIIEELENMDVDRRWLSIGKTHLEQGFMAINRAVFQPGRVKLPEDK